jgi:hypothetical protein
MKLVKNQVYLEIREKVYSQVSDRVCGEVYNHPIAQIEAKVFYQIWVCVIKTVKSHYQK